MIYFSFSRIDLPACDVSLRTHQYNLSKNFERPSLRTVNATGVLSVQAAGVFTAYYWYCEFHCIKYNGKRNSGITKEESTESTCHTFILTEIITARKPNTVRNLPEALGGMGTASAVVS
jgi:hypothetical protein